MLLKRSGLRSKYVDVGEKVEVRSKKFGRLPYLGKVGGQTLKLMFFRKRGVKVSLGGVKVSSGGVKVSKGVWCYPNPKFYPTSPQQTQAINSSAQEILSL
jgi:hypothetical protein